MAARQEVVRITHLTPKQQKIKREAIRRLRSRPAVLLYFDFRVDGNRDFLRAINKIAELAQVVRCINVGTYDVQGVKTVPTIDDDGKQFEGRDAFIWLAEETARLYETFVVEVEAISDMRDIVEEMRNRMIRARRAPNSGRNGDVMFGVASTPRTREIAPAIRVNGAASTQQQAYRTPARHMMSFGGDQTPQQEEPRQMRSTVTRDQRRRASGASARVDDEAQREARRRNASQEKAQMMQEAARKWQQDAQQQQAASRTRRFEPDGTAGRRQQFTEADTRRSQSAIADERARMFQMAESGADEADFHTRYGTTPMAPQPRGNPNGAARAAASPRVFGGR